MKLENKRFHTVLFFLTFPNKENNKFIFQDCVGTLVLCIATIWPVIKCFIVFFFYALVLLLSFFLRGASFLELLSNVLTRQYCVRWRSLLWCPGLCTAQPLERSLLRIGAMQAAGTSPSVDSAGTHSWTDQSKRGTAPNLSNELCTPCLAGNFECICALEQADYFGLLLSGQTHRPSTPGTLQLFFLLSLFLLVCCTDYWWKISPIIFFLLIIKYCNIFNIK